MTQNKEKSNILGVVPVNPVLVKYLDKTEGTEVVKLGFLYGDELRFLERHTLSNPLSKKFVEGVKELFYKFYKVVSVTQKE